MTIQEKLANTVKAMENDLANFDKTVKENSRTHEPKDLANIRVTRAKMVKALTETKALLITQLK